MEHYFTAKSSTENITGEIHYKVSSHKFTFTTSNAVFSKKQVDKGSSVLINTFLKYNMNSSGKLLEVGCGYGPIGITVAKILPKLTVSMVDVNERALELTKVNTEQNHVENVEDIRLSDRYENINSTYDYILTNPPIRAGKDIVHSIYEGAIKHLNAGGKLYVVIRKKQGAKSSIKKIQEIFGNCKVLAKDAGYYILEAIKD
ncbi:class I SAM-dependent methyltransferase [Clostridiaceae bacterium M8S5]|nr:class I SAM-dependent methyltransferase [Clostridiaceae bacterium M8S5]